MMNLKSLFQAKDSQFIKLLLEGAKKENSATYNENKNVFDKIIEDCENYSIIELGYNEQFSIKIL